MQDLISSLLQQQVGEAFQKKAAESFGLKSDQAKVLTQNALPVIMNGLAKNTENASGAESLFKALQSSKHDGNILSHVDGLLKDPEKGEGLKILTHILGETREEVAETLGVESETGKDKSQKMMMVLAPMIMGALGKAVRSEKLSAQQLGALLQVVRNDGNWTLKANKIANQFLDRNKDGHYKDDLFNMAKNWLNQKLNKKK